MDSGGLDFSYSELSNATGVAKVVFVGEALAIQSNCTVEL